MFTRIRRTPVALAVLSLLLVAGCATGSDSAPPQRTVPQGPSTATSTAETAPASPGSLSSQSPVVSAPFVDQKAARRLSKAEIAQAWKFSTGLTAEYAYNPALMDTAPGKVTKGDLADITRMMKPATRRLWEKSIDQLPKAKASGEVNSFALQGLRDDGYVLNADKPVRDFAISGTVGSFDSDTVVTKQNVRVSVHMLKPDKAKVHYTISKTLTLYLTKVGGKYVIEGWNCVGTSSNATPDP